MEKTDGHESALIDVSDRTMLDLMTSREPGVMAALRRLLAAREQPRDVLLGWSNAHVIGGVTVDTAAADHAEREQSNPVP